MRINFIKLTLRQDRTNGTPVVVRNIFVNPSEISSIYRYGERNYTSVYTHGNSWEVEETPEQIMLMINSPFAKQKVEA